MRTMHVRLDDDLSERLDAAVRKSWTNRSEVVRDILRQWLPRKHELTPRERYERVKHIIGSLDSGFTDLGRNHEEYLQRYFDAKRDETMGR